MSDGERATEGGASDTPGRDPVDRPEVIVALDYPDAASALGLVDALPGGTWYKVGMELFTAEGPSLVRRLAERGHPVFLDLKLHDIPNTVAGAVRSAAGLGVRLLTVHAAGGGSMLRAAATAATEAAREAAAGSGSGGFSLLAVTVLTSMDETELASVSGVRAPVGDVVLRRARLARDAGVAGVVASVEECRLLKDELGRELAVATPGIRLPGDAAHDQRRVATPRDAAGAGADYLVVGRSITGADDPAAALEEVRASAAGA